MKRILYWLPRTLSLGLALFLSLFALDVFTEAYLFWETILALIIHMLPTCLILIVLAIAWHWERLGGSIFIILSIAFLLLSRFELEAFLIIGLPALVIGGLFLWNSTLT
jgi:hypothetical protein